MTYIICDNCGWVGRPGEIECPRCFADLSCAEIVTEPDPLPVPVYDPADLIV